jgi:hypothetical protein
MTYLLYIGIFLLGFIAAIIIISLANGPSNAGHVDDYNAALEKAHQIPTIAPDSDAEAAAIQAWQEALADLTFPTEKQKTTLGKVYADELFFNDTLKTLRSGKAVEEHLLATADLLTSGSVKCFTSSRDENGDYSIRWEMSYAGPKMNGGEPIVTIGMTQLRFNEKGEVIYHQDFWDSSTGVFEHIPLVGGLVKFVRGRM